MVRFYQVSSSASLYRTRFLTFVVLATVFFVSTVLYAEVSSEIARFTVHREKVPECVSSAQATEKPSEIEITEQSGVYRIKVIAVIAAPASYVRQVLTDYSHIYRLNPSIIESEVLKRDADGSVNVRTRVIGCAAYFCEELDRVEKVKLLPSGDLHAEIIPELSQFKSGQTHWRIKARGDHCEVSYLSEVEPDIFIPPLVGEFLIKKSIRQEMQVSFVNLEKISSVLAERDGQENYQLANNNQVVAKNESEVRCFNRAGIASNTGE